MELHLTVPGKKTTKTIETKDKVKDNGAAMYNMIQGRISSGNGCLVM